MRIGHGYDVHKLVEGRDLILGGVKIPFLPCGLSSCVITPTTENPLATISTSGFTANSGVPANTIFIGSLSYFSSSIWLALSMYNTPSRWSNSWQIARAKKPFACKVFLSPKRSE